MTLPEVILQQQKQYVYLYVNMHSFTGGTADKRNWLFKTPDSFLLQWIRLCIASFKYQETDYTFGFRPAFFWSIALSLSAA